MQSPTLVRCLGCAIALVSLEWFHPTLPQIPSHWGFTPAIAQANPPSGTGHAHTGNRRATIRKNICPEVSIPLTALTPEPEPKNVGGKTVATHPTFWFYVPYTQAQRFTGEFTLKDDQGTVIHTTAPRLPETAGVISIQIPPTAAALKADQIYQWSFRVKCAKRAVAVNGWIQRVQLDGKLARQIETAQQVSQQAELYQANGIWFDALTLAAEGQATGAKTPSTHQVWNKLMDAINLPEMKSVPIVL